MTNELAIKILTGDVIGTTEQTHEAINMAVKALSEIREMLETAQPNLQPTCNQLTTDSISRQAVIDALCDNCNNVQAVCPHYPCKQFTAIEALPSAQPERDTGYSDGFADGYKQGMKDAQPELIEQIKWERDTAIQQLKELGYGLGQKPRMDDPTIKSEPKTGEWIEIPDEVFASTYQCSECGAEPLIDGSEYALSNYCPNCGADMRTSKC